MSGVLLSGSELARPVSVTGVVPSFTVWSIPASETGATFVGGTSLTVTVMVSGVGSASPRLSVTTSENVSTVPAGATDGAVKVGWAAVVLLRVTVGEPPVCDHE